MRYDGYYTHNASAYCPDCGRAVEADSNYCRFCGKKL
ncbi:MAG: zinc-ribbon domain-containing protein [Eubacteriaceae bacterium]|nr:zinc-ribbon domain-containing protein [Eubacteriaceae bacterium]